MNLRSVLLLIFVLAHQYTFGQERVKRKPLVIELTTMEGEQIAGRILDVTDSSVLLKNDHRAGMTKGLRKNSVEYSYGNIKEIVAYKSQAKKGAIIGFTSGALLGAGIAAATYEDDGFFPLWFVAVSAGTFFGAAGSILGTVIGSTKVDRDPNFVYINGQYQNFELNRRNLYMRSAYRPKKFKVYFAGGPYFTADENQDVNGRPRAHLFGFDFQLRHKHAVGIYYQGFQPFTTSIYDGETYLTSERFYSKNIGFEYKYNLWPKSPGIESRFQIQPGAAFLLNFTQQELQYLYYDAHSSVGLNLSVTADIYIVRNFSIFLRPSYDLKPDFSVDGYLVDLGDATYQILPHQVNMSTFILNWGIKLHLP